MHNRLIRDARLGRRLFAVASPRVYYLVIPKCGCTFVKNVLWWVQNHKFYHDPMRIHDADDLFLRASDVEQDLANVFRFTNAFTVLRNPIDRFLSLYFDKVVGTGRKDYVPLYDTLVRRHSLIADPFTVRDHQYNLECMADWIAENLQTELDLRPESHWTPQSYRSTIMSMFDLAVLTVDDLTAGLERIFAMHIPNIREVLDCAERNRSDRDFRKGEIVTDALRRKVNSIYSVDRAMYRGAKALWDEVSRPAGDGCELPRFSDLKF